MPSAAIHGKAATIYLGAAGAAAIPIGEMLDWSIDFDMALVDVTPLNNTWKNFVKGMMGYTLTVNGNFNPGSNQLFLSSTSAVKEAFYLYPQTGQPTQYYYGTAWIQLGKVVAGSTTAKASSGFKGTGDDSLNKNP